MIQDILSIYQKNCRNEILNSITRNNKTLVIKSPTGSGKTVILLSVIDKYLNDGGNACFVWLCPGTGDLEQQSKKSMEEKCPNLETRELSDVLSSGFELGATYFINWEQIVNKSNVALKPAERRNLYKRIGDAHRNHIEFIVIVDEEQTNDTTKAQNVLDAIDAKKEIRMSATARRRPTCDFYEIKEQDVIDEGFISKAIVINEDLSKYKVTNENEVEVLINLALNKRIEIAKEYEKIFEEGKIGFKVNPLIIIQFPSSSNKLIEDVEDFLAKKNITYDCFLSKWMADAKDKINLGLDPDWEISDNDAAPFVLLMKQAISEGWDCPRAKILVKLRDNMDEDFEIQTIGRIRRMPDRKHYGINTLDYCYLYTLDDKYVESVRQSTNNLYEIRECKLKEDFKNVILTKELKHSDTGEVDPKVALKSLVKHFKTKYSTGDSKKENIKKLEEGTYNLSKDIVLNVREGEFATFEDLREDDPLQNTKIHFGVDTSKYGYRMMNAIAHISSSCGIRSDICKILLRRLFLRNENYSSLILSLSLHEYYAFVINNEIKLKDDFREAANELTKQLYLHLDPITEDFKIPETEKIKFDPTERATSPMKKNVYEGYTQQMLAGNLRWKSERMLEKYCENSSKVEWIYKNGNVGIEYFCVVYCDNFGKEWSFYPDYIIKLNDGTIWIIETKGGENKDGESQNIDKKSLNKFESFKIYASKHSNIKWGFVRNYNDNLYLNNTEYVDSMNDKKWLPIEELF